MNYKNFKEILIKYLFISNTLNFKKNIFWIAILNSFSNIFDIGTLLSLPLVISIIIEKKQSFFGYPIGDESYPYILLIVLLLFFLRSLLISTVSRVNSNFTWRLTKKLNNLTYEIYLRMPYQQFQKNKVSRLVRDVTGEVTAISQVTTSIINIFSEALILVLASIFAMIYDFKMTLMVLTIIIILILIINYLITSKINYYGALRVKSERKMYDISTSSFIGIKDIIANELFPYYKNIFSEEVELREKACSNHLFYNSLPKVILEFGVIFTLILLLYSYLSIMGKNINEIVVLFAALTAVAFRILPGISKLVTALQNLNFNYETIKHYVNIIKHESKDHLIKFKNSNHESIVKIENLKFSYESSEQKFIISDFQINHGDFIGLSGESGSGKSTIISLILGLYKPISGEITYNNKINSVIDIGYVDQRAQVLEESIYYNITLTKTKNKNLISKFNKILDLVDLRDFYKSNCNKDPDFELKLLGGNVSGGQAQRIGIARALFKDPSLLILDEFTSALDEKIEDKILDTIQKIKDKSTVLIISHSQKVLKFCDKVYKVKNGKLCT